MTENTGAEFAAVRRKYFSTVGIMFPTPVNMTHRNLKRIGFFSNPHRFDANNISFPG